MKYLIAGDLVKSNTITQCKEPVFFYLNTSIFYVIWNI